MPDRLAALEAGVATPVTIAGSATIFCERGLALQALTHLIEEALSRASDESVLSFIAATHGAKMERGRKDNERNRGGQKVQADISEIKPAAGQPE